LLDTRTAHFLDLVGNGRVYRVPAYQRDYSWQEEQWDDLWSDLSDLRRQPAERHYMGALVVEAKTDREFLVLDGQQRLATLSLLVLAVIDKLGRLADAGEQPGENRERAAALRARFVGEKDPASLIESSKLSLNETDNPLFQDYLVQLRRPLNPRGLPRSNRLLYECFRFFVKKLDDEVDALSDGEALAQLVTESVGRKLLFILITVDDDLNAYTVFETLNARGLELSTTDLLKNYLFSRIKVESDLNALQRRWRALISTVQQKRFPDLLRYHLLCEVPRVRGERLFKLVSDRVKTPEAVFELMAALEGRAELYSALDDAAHPHWLERPACRPHVRELQLFRIRQVTPLLFATWERFSKDDFTRVLKLVSVVSFRYSVVGGLNPNALEQVYHLAAKAVLEGTVRNPQQVFEYLRPIAVDERKFEQDFAQLEIDTNSQRKRLAKYILARLEHDASGRATDPDTDPATIEHILPENPGTAWEAMFPRQHWDRLTYRIGNLTLLEPALNRRIGNSSYQEKCDAYAHESVYDLTRDIAKNAPEEWTPAHLDHRQQQLARRALHVWRVDFA